MRCRRSSESTSLATRMTLLSRSRCLDGVNMLAYVAGVVHVVQEDGCEAAAFLQFRIIGRHEIDDTGERRVEGVEGRRRRDQLAANLVRRIFVHVLEVNVPRIAEKVFDRLEVGKRA